MASRGVIVNIWRKGVDGEGVHTYVSRSKCEYDILDRRLLVYWRCRLPILSSFVLSDQSFWMLAASLLYSLPPSSSKFLTVLYCAVAIPSGSLACSRICVDMYALVPVFNVLRCESKTPRRQLSSYSTLPLSVLDRHVQYQFTANIVWMVDQSVLFVSLITLVSHSVS